MSTKDRFSGGPPTLKLYLGTLALLWSAVVVASVVWNALGDREHAIAQARIQAGIALEKDILYRRWNAGHGGVYVPVTGKTRPNPWLEGVPERDLVSTAGEVYTLVNPAFMTREVHELGRLGAGVRGHITSLRPIRPENAPDFWERRALEAFERGEREVVSLESFEGAMHLRLMRPLVTEQACLKCHEAQGYRAGDVRGGISVSVPMAPLTELTRRHLLRVGAGHLLLWAAGLGLVAAGGWRLLRADRERSAAEANLCRERETLRLLYEGNPDAVAVIDREFRVIYANDRVQELTGIPREALQGRTCHEGILGCAVPCDGCLVGEVFREGKPQGRIKHETTAAGRENWLWQQWYPVVGADGGVESVVEIARDVSELKRAEADLQRHAQQLEEANRMKDLFTDIMSHDLLNPAAAARYFLEHLRETDADPAHRPSLDAIGRNLNRLTAMIQSASAYSKLKETKELAVKVEDLGEIVRGAVAELEPELRAAGMAVEMPMPGRYPAAVNPVFAHVVTNLVGNAAKYAAPGKRVAVGIADAGTQWVLSVRDWGEGIADAHKKSLFTRFERLGKEGVKGTGLGLAISKRIVELHGGTIRVEDNPEGGCVFLASVPKAHGDAVG